MTPTERLLTILRFLGEARGADAADAQMIRDEMGMYDGIAGARKWRRDIRTLRDRGLIETDLTKPMTPNRTGIRLRGPKKPDRLHLTSDELMAIWHEWRARRSGIGSVSPFLTSLDSATHEIDDVGRILRFLEHSEDEIELVQLAEWMQVPESRAVELLNVLSMESVFNGGLVVSVELASGDDDGDDPQVTAVRVFRGRPCAGSPIRGRGMDELGFFPYSLSETVERLALIEQALASDDVGEGRRRVLRNAQHKLFEWRDTLTDRPMS